MFDIKKRAMGKLGDKLKDATPGLMNFAVDNDQGYNNLIQTLRNINKKRRDKRKYIFEINAKLSLKRQ